MAVTVAVLVAAVLHAGWNALLKGVEDRLATVVLLDLTGLAVAAAAAVPLVPVPAPASRGLLALAGAGRGARWRAAVGPALATGVFIAAYTVADGLGVRRAGTVTGYVAWLFLLHGCRSRCTPWP